MNFDLTEERQMLQDTLRRFLADRYDVATRNRIIESPAGFNTDIWRGLAELGVIGALFPEDRGGFGGAGFDIAVLFEEFGRAGVVEPFLETAVLAGHLIDDPPMLEQIIAGEMQLAFAHGEPASRYDLSRVATTATEVNGSFRISGRKTLVHNAEGADWLIVSAREAGGVSDTSGLSLFLVDPKSADIQGYALTAGGRAAEVLLDNAEGTRIGDGGTAFPRISRAVAAATVAVCAEALGAMETAVRLTTGYLETRKQFGKPIGTFQALQHRLADMLIELEQARSAVILAAGHLETAPDMRDLHISAAKNLIGRVGRLIAEESIQMHGGIAMTQEYELAHIAKRIVMTDHRFGDTDHHLERFIELSA